MSARSFDTGFRRAPRRQDWVSRTVDLETTADFLPDSAVTSDLPALITHDFVIEPVVSGLDSRALKRATQPHRTLDLPTPAAESAPANKDVEAPSVTLEPGSVLSDRYLLEQIIGTGGTAIVFRARDMRSSSSTAPNVQVAIKTPRLDFTDRPRAIARLQHEYKCMHRLDHPSVVKVFDIQHDAETWFMTMELIEGKPLSALLHNGTTLTKAVTQQVLSSCADALAHAHERGVVHGDFKPANVFVGRTNSVKVLDFGAAFSPTASDSRIPAGTPAYASPEVLSGLDPEPRDDVFSFACVAYEMLTGRHPYERRSSIEAREAGAVPPRAWTLSANQWLSLLQALSLDRQQRPSDIRLLADVLHKEPQIAPDAMIAKADVPVVPASPPLPDDILPAQRGWGFFVFVAIALALLFFAAHRNWNSDSVVAPSAPTAPSIPAPPLAENPTAVDASSASASPASAAEAEKKSAVVTNGTAQGHASAAQVAANSSAVDHPGSTGAANTATAANTARPARATFASEVGFASSTIVTSENSIAAVFIVKRTGSLSGRSVVRWNAESGTAKNGEDFIAGNGGTVEFAPGQSQRAIYVPLRNDTEHEGDEEFTLVITSAQRAKVGAIAKVKATIRDDD